MITLCTKLLNSVGFRCVVFPANDMIPLTKGGDLLYSCKPQAHWCLAGLFFGMYRPVLAVAL